MVDAILVVQTLAIPVIIILIGFLFKKNPPQNMRGMVGYRTKRSRASKDAWDYAQIRSAELFYNLGFKMLIASVILNIIMMVIPAIRNSEVTFTVVSTIILVLQILVLCSTVYIVEKELKEKFE